MPNAEKVGISAVDQSELKASVSGEAERLVKRNVSLRDYLVKNFNGPASVAEETRRFLLVGLGQEQAVTEPMPKITSSAYISDAKTLSSAISLGILEGLRDAEGIVFDRASHVALRAADAIVHGFWVERDRRALQS